MDDTSRELPSSPGAPGAGTPLSTPASTRAAPPAFAPPGAEPLEALADLAERAGASAIAAEAREVRARLAAGRFVVACVGEFKRGKSTLLNALLGRRVLPAGVVPVTSVVTAVRHGAAARAGVRFLDGSSREAPLEDLAAFVSERENPSNRKGVAVVEVALPHPLLEGGLCLVDTPGIGSVFEANSEATRAFLPHIDVALVVLGADPPVSGEELALIEEIRLHADRCLFVLNKADRVPPADLEEARRFTRDLLVERFGKEVGPLFAVSAAERLPRDDPGGPQGAPAASSSSSSLPFANPVPCAPPAPSAHPAPPAPRDWPSLVETLRSLARDSGAALVGRAERRWAERLAERLAADLGEQRRALTLPLDESRARVEGLRRAASEARRSFEDLGAVFLGRQQRLSQGFRGWRDAFLERIRPEAARILHDRLASPPDGKARGGLGERRAAMKAALDVAREAIEEWLRDAEPHARDAYAKEARYFLDLASGLLDSSPDLAGEARQLRASLESLDLGFRTRCRFTFHDLEGDAEATPLDLLRQVALPSDRAARRLEAAAQHYLSELLRVNATRVVNDLDEHVLESRRRLESEILFTLREIAASAARALDLAAARHREGEEATRRALQRIHEMQEALRGTSAAGEAPPA